MSESRKPIPPPGRALVFPIWSRLVVDRIRASVPDVVATTTPARRSVSLSRLGGLRATIVDDEGCWWIRSFGPGGGPGLVLYDATRHDEFTAMNIARSLVGFFDPARSMTGE